MSAESSDWCIKPELPNLVFPWENYDPRSREEVETFFNCPEIRAMKERICDIGRRLWTREYVDGNGGNISVRVAKNLLLCSPTLISKGFMKPSDMCFVNMNGEKIAGSRRRTSEVLAHLAIMKRQPLAKACCHAHPPHATAFALAGKKPPRNVNPETEIFIGDVGLAPYDTPGTQRLADKIGELGLKHDCIFMVNHGVITWASDIETAFWKMENVEAHCYTSIIAQAIGGFQQFSDEKAKELLPIRDSLGFVKQY